MAHTLPYFNSVRITPIIVFAIGLAIHFSKRARAH